jgi:hypothetical protein
MGYGYENPDKCIYVYDSFEKAKMRRAHEGGHVFLRDNGEAWWFSVAWMPTEILMTVRGGGVLNPSEEDVRNARTEIA